MCLFHVAGNVHCFRLTKEICSRSSTNQH